MKKQRYKEDGFTTNTPSKEGYWLTSNALKRVKKASLKAGIDWCKVASEPRSARVFVEIVEYDMHTQETRRLYND